MLNELVTGRKECANAGMRTRAQHRLPFYSWVILLGWFFENQIDPI